MFSFAKKAFTFEETSVNKNKYVYFRLEICHDDMFFLGTIALAYHVVTR